MRDTRIVIMMLFVTLVFGYGFSRCSGSDEEQASNDNGSVNTEPANTLPANLSNALASTEEDDGGEYAVFRHAGDYHSRLPCLACHTRESNSARISFPGRVDHSPCAGCHTLQFKNKNSSICTICHTEPAEGDLKAFPRLKSFGTRFVHSKHLRTNCGTCHKPSGKTLSIPRGGNAHTTCFACHSSNASNTLASCGTCHQPGAGRMSAPGGARAFRANFSHARHGRAQNLNCSDCHTVYAGRSRSNQVSAPVTIMHSQSSRGVSCATCHNGARAFGAEDFTNCKRCHTGNNFSF